MLIKRLGVSITVTLFFGVFFYVFLTKFGNWYSHRVCFSRISLFYWVLQTRFGVTGIVNTPIRLTGCSVEPYFLSVTNKVRRQRSLSDGFGLFLYVSETRLGCCK